MLPSWMALKTVATNPFSWARRRKSFCTSPGPMRPSRSMSFSRKPAFIFQLNALSKYRDFSPSLGMTKGEVVFHDVSLVTRDRFNASTVQRFNGRWRRHFHRQHLHAQIIQHHRREDQAGNTHELFANDQCDQRQPNGIAYSVADNLAV